MAELTAQQLTDLADLLARHLRADLLRLAETVLHRDIKDDVANVLDNQAALAAKLVDLLVEAHALRGAIDVLRTDYAWNAVLMLELNQILRPIAPTAFQAFKAENEPFIKSKQFEQMFPRVRRTVCFIALDHHGIKMRGTGFLIGPDLVMTNYHVVEPLLKTNTNPAQENESGDKIYCIFDYESPPAPPMPPMNDPNRVVQGVSQGWLQFGRPTLANDGTDKAGAFTNELDFVVIKLARAIGKLPSRPGGGVPRGWLTLEQAIDLNDQPRIILFQHPGQLPQVFDMGPFHSLDTSKSRVRYWLNSAEGSSGGAAIDVTGKLFAIHNATVLEKGKNVTQGDRTLNQGIRIDQIRADIHASAPTCLAPAPPQTILPFWSLTDDFANPEPVIGRSSFQDIVAEMLKLAGPRVAVVTGPPDSGVRFSIELLKRTLGAQVPVVEIQPTEIEKHTPKDFLQVIINELGVTQAGSIPEPRETEDIPQWLRNGLAPYLLTLLTAEQGRAPSRFPAWIVINTLGPRNSKVPAGKRLIWANNLRDFVSTMIGVRDSNQAPFDIPQLRWVFLARSAEALPLGNVEKRDENLSGAQEKDLFADFAECLQTAWQSLDGSKGEISPPFLMVMAGTEVAKNLGKPTRKVLADYVSQIISVAVKRATNG